MKQRVVWQEVDHSKHDGKFPELKDSIHDPIMPRDRTIVTTFIGIH